MAVPVLKRAQGIVWLPPRSTGERALVNEAVLLVTHGGDSQRGRYLRCSLEALPELKSVTLVFDARDVALLTPAVPALPPGKLLRAMPNIVEDLLLQDAAGCAFALGPALDEGRRLVAVIDRAWLEAAVGAFERRGMAVTAAWPAQLCLPLRGEADAADKVYAFIQALEQAALFPEVKSEGISTRNTPQGARSQFGAALVLPGTGAEDEP